MSARPLHEQRTTITRLLATILALSLLSVACGPKRQSPPPPPMRNPNAGVGTPDRPVTPAPTLSARIEPQSIRQGDSALLSWESNHASGVSIEPGLGDVDGIGQVRVYPDQTTTYRLAARGPGGQVAESVTIEVIDSVAPGGIRSENIDLSELPIDERFELAVRPIFFDFDSATLSAEAMRILDANADWLNRPDHAGIRFIIQGHCDERGTDEYNLALGDRRAVAARDYLRSKGVASPRVTVISLGEERPFDSGTDESAYASNRRAHFVFRSIQ